LAIKRLKLPETGQATTWDTKLPGFGIRCSQGGTKTFIVMHGKQRRRVTIGRYPVVSLSAARQKAKEILLNAALNIQQAPKDEPAAAGGRCAQSLPWGHAVTRTTQ